MWSVRKVDHELLKEIKKLRCISCGLRGRKLHIDPCHIVSRGAGGPDERWNVIPMCRRCHNLQHSVGIFTFVTERPHVTWTLKTLGWEFDDNHMHHPKKKDIHVWREQV